jgi:hypothetical protein
MASCLLPAISSAADVSFIEPITNDNITADANHKISVKFTCSAGYQPSYVKLTSASGAVEYGRTQSQNITKETDPDTGVTTCECLLYTGMVDLTDVTVTAVASKPNPNPPYDSILAYDGLTGLDIKQP